MFGAKNEDEFYDDDDYAYNRQRKAKENDRKLKALSYDTGRCKKSKIITNPLEPILR